MTHLMTISPWANPQVIVAFIGLLTAALGAGGVWELRNAKKRKRLSAEEAEQAQAVERAAAGDPLVGEAMTIIEQWKSMVTQINAHHDEQLRAVNERLDAEVGARSRLQDEVDALKRESNAQSRELFTLRTSLARIESWWQSVRDDWARVRQMEEPPSMPPINLD